MRAPRPSAFGLAPIVLSVAFAIGAFPFGLRAQPPRVAAVGATVRVMALPPDGWREGRLVAHDGDRLVLRGVWRGSGSVPAVDTIPLATVQRLEVRRGPNRALRALGFGVLGGLAGVAAGAAVGAQSTAPEGDDPGINAIAGGAVGGLVGLGLGALIGGGTGGRWAPARLPGAAAP